MIEPLTLLESLPIYIGATFNPEVVWSSSILGNYVDLTGYTAKMDIRSWVGSSNLIANLNTSNGGIAINNPSNGTASLLLTATQTAALSPTPIGVPAVFDLQFTSASSLSVDYLLQGNVVIQQMVTR